MNLPVWLRRFRFRDPTQDGDGAINLIGITGTKIGDVGGRSSPLAIELPACIRGRCF